MTATRVSGRHARLDVSIDGIRITRSPSEAAHRHVDRILEVEWDRVAGASLESSRKGRPIVRVRIAGAAQVQDHRDDPYAVKVGHADAETAAALVAMIEHEVQVRRQWLAQAASEPVSTETDRDPAVTGC